MDNRFVIVIGSRNNAQWVESNLNSVLVQDYPNYEVVYFNDASTDDTYEKAETLLKGNPRHHIYNVTERKYKTWFFSGIENDPRINLQDNDVLVFLDGDDMLYAENVLSYLNDIYNKSNCWMTYGGMMVWGGGTFISEPFPQNTVIPPEVISNKAYRKDTWRTSHLKTMRGFVWKAIDKADLFPDGKYMVGPDDLAIMFGALELCPPQKVYRVTEPIYLYNHTPENLGSRAFTDHKETKIDYETIVRSRTPYDTIPFVTPTLVGGLGNVMFEVAAAAAVATDNNAVTLVNNSAHLCPNQGRNVNNYTNNILSRLNYDSDISANSIFEQEGYLYKPIPYKPNMRISGHFQSWKYFDHHKDYIQKLFAPTPEIQKELDEKFGWLRDCTSIQIRRGDALSARAVGYHPVPTLEYIHNAIERVNPTQIVVFSDDIPWCKENMKFDVPCNFDASQGELRDYMEIYMMSMCKNVIISNSTFGWWGAYLNTRPDKTVIAPTYWFGPKITDHGFDINELLPNDWIQI